MLKAIMASLTGLAGDHAVLKTAAAVAAVEGGHIDAVHVYAGLESIQQMAWSGAGTRSSALASLSADFAREEQQRLKAAHTAFDEACLRFNLPPKPGPGGGTSASWQCIDSLSIHETARRARCYDLTVVAREAQLLPERVTDILMHSGRPLLIAPPRPFGEIGKSIAIAWKPGQQMARALSAASTFLRHAEKVVLIAVPESNGGEQEAFKTAEPLQGALSWAGIALEIVMAPRTNDIADTIQKTALKLESDLLIAGAYGHSRLREFVLGGVTRELLAECSLPVLLMH